MVCVDGAKMTNAEMVKEWHEKFGVPAPMSPAIPAQDRQILRCALIQEEFEEFQTACLCSDLKLAADALADILYVVYSTAVEFGLPIDAIFQEVHRSNMTKIWPDGTVHYRDDGKVIKPDTYSPPNLEPFLK